MIATITVNSHSMASARESRFSLNSNSAGAPLPMIPRRSSARPPLTASVSLPACLSASSSVVTVSSLSSSPAPPSTASSRHDSDSSSSSSSPSDGSRPTIRTRRARRGRVSPDSGSRNPAPACTTDATPRSIASRPMLYTPGMSLHTLKTRNASESHIFLAEGSKTAVESFEEIRVIRKKSGQLVKPSLKTSRSNSRTNLSILTSTGISSKSEPVTPTHKAVHFDSKLEHVKLFLAEQKPLAVSRDGSPTDDTSGTDSDFPKFIYGDNDDRRPKRKLTMQVANMPPRISPNLDVALEELSLGSDGSTIVGRVRVRNISYSKWLAVRFTFDSWQTTSEVVGRYVESIGPEFDRFAFTIRLNDLLARIEGKTLIMAIRYSVEGREMWDNNNGANYYATFSKNRVDERRRATFSDDEASDIADLQSKLEKVSQSKDRTGPAFLHQPRRQSTPEADSFRSGTSLASRYDFSASLKGSWKPTSSPGLHNRAQSFPVSNAKVLWITPDPSELLIPKRAVPNALKIEADLRFPRESDVDFQSALELEDAPFQPPARGGRNHQRGYFDLVSAPPTLKKTPPGTPPTDLEPAALDADALVPPLPSRSYSFPPSIGGPTRSSLDVKNAVAEQVMDSDLSTPSMTTPSSSRSSTPSPSDPFPMIGLPKSDEVQARQEDCDPHYRELISKFCFFTGRQYPAAFAISNSLEIPPPPVTLPPSVEMEQLALGLTTLSFSPASTSSPLPSDVEDMDTVLGSGAITPTLSHPCDLAAVSSTPIVL